MSYFPRHPFQRLLNDELPPSISGWGPFEMYGCFNRCRCGRPQGHAYLPPPAPPQASYYAQAPNANVAWLAAQQNDYGGLPPNVDPSWNAAAPMPSGGPSMALNPNNGGAAGFNVPAPHQDDLVKAAEQSQDDNTIFYGGAGAPRNPIVAGVGALTSLRRARVGPSVPQTQNQFIQQTPGSARYITRHPFHVPAGTTPQGARAGSTWYDSNGTQWRGQQGAFGVYGVPTGQQAHKAVYPGGPRIIG